MKAGKKAPPTPSEGSLLSLFCGPGGLDEGFKQAGFHTDLAFDIHADSIDTFKLNHPQARAAVQDITKLSLNKLDKLAGAEFFPTGIIGGPPCQCFSVANVFQKEDDPRRELTKSYLRLLRRLNRRRPVSFFLFENVTAIQSSKHKSIFDSFVQSVDKEGFAVSSAVLDAYDFGVPQRRKRLFVIGINRELYPNADWVWPAPLEEKTTVKDAIYSLPEPVHRNRFSAEGVPVHPNHWCMTPRSLKFSNGFLSNGKSIKSRSFRRLDWEKPSWTVAYGNREVHVHPSGKRRLSVFEAMLLQGFPEHYVLAGSLSSQIKQVSEAVPPALAAALANAIKECLGEEVVTYGRCLHA